MCGIMGVIGAPDAPDLVKKGLRALEYRGYDSCGVAWLDNGVHVAKAVGPVGGLELPATAATIALGHTRWATHGGVTQANAHPHLDEGGNAAVVHNGVLLNHLHLRAELEAEGTAFRSETDSEVLAHLWSRVPNRPAEDRMAAMKTVLQGTYSVAVLDGRFNAIHVTKHRNPLWLAVKDGVTLFASDPIALRPYVRDAVPLEDGDQGVLRAGDFELRDAEGRPVNRPSVSIEGLDDRVDKAGFEHFMLKEIHESPAALNRLLATHLRQDAPYVAMVPAAYLRQFQRVLCLGAGTSFHAGMLGAEWMQRIARTAAMCRATPEFKDDLDVPEVRTLLLALSQSGETLDTLQAMHRLRSHPVQTLALTSQPTSTIGRLADHAVPLRSGVEISVAATKTFLAQALLLYLLALAKGRQRGALSDAAAASAARQLILLPRMVEGVLQRTQEVQAMARRLAQYENMFLLAKGLLLPVAMEGALKLKEIAYQHAEAYPAGELKHGPFALLTPATPVVFLLANDRNAPAILNSMQEVHARGAPTFAIVAGDGLDPGAAADVVLRVPESPEHLSPFVFASALHLLSYWVAKARGLPIDRPRNLAKSVTVE